jgi:hypothetical protein
LYIIIIIIFIPVYFIHSYILYSFYFWLRPYFLYVFFICEHSQNILWVKESLAFSSLCCSIIFKCSELGNINNFQKYIWCMVSVSLNGFIYVLVEHVFSIFKPSNTIVFVICYLTVTSILTLHHLRWFGNMILKMAICLSALLILAYEIIITCYCFCVSNVFF